MVLLMLFKERDLTNRRYMTVSAALAIAPAIPGPAEAQCG